MNIWTAFFLVISVVILASPLLSSRDIGKNGSDSERGGNDRPHWENGDLKLDLASGRLSREDFETMTGRRIGSPTELMAREEGEDGNLPED